MVETAVDLIYVLAWFAAFAVALSAFALCFNPVVLAAVTESESPKPFTYWVIVVSVSACGLYLLGETALVFLENKSHVG